MVHLVANEGDEQYQYSLDITFVHASYIPLIVVRGEITILSIPYTYKLVVNKILFTSHMTRSFISTLEKCLHGLLIGP
jgi:hypothetical protein